MNSREEVEQYVEANVDKLYVPEVVKDNVHYILEDMLKRCGLYYYIESRIKEQQSMIDKIEFKHYGYPADCYDGEIHKLQDLIGFRINVYFVDDLSICKTLLEDVFEQIGDWSVSQNKNSEFKAAKINGIFKLPTDFVKIINNPLVEVVDNTFEIQLRTVSFQGWHEIEHDLSYKGLAFAEDDKTSRKLNSILATLELCDDSMLQVVQKAGQKHFLAKNWIQMLQCQFRIHLKLDTLEPEMENLLIAEEGRYGQYAYGYERKELLMQLSKRYEASILSTNQLLKIILDNHENREEFYWNQADYKPPVEKERVERNKKLSSALMPYRENKVFSAEVYVGEQGQELENFNETSQVIYDWVYYKYHNVFPIPEQIESMEYRQWGYEIHIDLNEKEKQLECEVVHPGNKIPGRTWVTKVSLKQEIKGLHFLVENVYCDCRGEDLEYDNVAYSCPRFYRDVVERIGVRDIEPLDMKPTAIDNEVDFKRVIELIESPERKMPVVLVAYEKEKKWCDPYYVNQLSKLVGIIAHVYTVEDDCVAMLAEYLEKEEELLRNSISMKLPRNSRWRVVYQENIENCKCQIVKLSQNSVLTNLSGSRAFRYRLVADIRRENVRE